MKNSVIPASIKNPYNFDNSAFRVPADFKRRYPLVGERGKVKGPISHGLFCPGIHRERLLALPRFSMEGFVKVQVVDCASGVVVSEQPYQPNLILNQGMDNLAAMVTCELFNQCCYGDGTTDTKLASGATTASQASTTVTASASIFVAGDVGNMIKWDTGEEARIISYTSGTEVEVANAATVASGTFTIHRTNQTQLTAEIQRSNTYLTGSGNCESSVTSNIITNRRTFDFSPVVSGETVREIGFARTATPTNNLNTRIFLSTPQALLIGQALRVVYDFQVTMSPTTPEAKTFSITGWPVAPSTSLDGDQQWVGICLSGVRPSDGTTQSAALYNAGINGNNFPMEPFASGASGTQTGCGFFMSSNSGAIASFNSSTGAFTGYLLTNAYLSLVAYTTLNFYRDKTKTLAVSEGNGTTIRTIGIGSGTSPGSANAYGFIMLFDQPQTKDNTHTLQMTWRWTWGRTLVN